tara:strand:- start:1212 stop:1484 length:273 start_codon:yes stop_codon:yes gene_type:complete
LCNLSSICTNSHVPINADSDNLSDSEQLKKKLKNKRRKKFFIIKYFIIDAKKLKGCVVFVKLFVNLIKIINSEIDWLKFIIKSAQKNNKL